MKFCISDEALFSKIIEDELSGLRATYVDDTISAGNLK